MDALKQSDVLKNSLQEYDRNIRPKKRTRNLGLLAIGGTLIAANELSNISIDNVTGLGGMLALFGFGLEHAALVNKSVRKNKIRVQEHIEKYADKLPEFTPIYTLPTTLSMMIEDSDKLTLEPGSAKYRSVLSTIADHLDDKSFEGVKRNVAFAIEMSLSQFLTHKLDNNKPELAAVMDKYFPIDQTRDTLVNSDESGHKSWTSYIDQYLQDDAIKTGVHKLWSESP